MVAALVEQNLAQSHSAGEAPAKIEVIDPATLPSEPSGPNRAGVVARGGFAGLVIGLVCGALWWMTRRRRHVSLLQLGGFAAAGMLLGLAIAFLIPNEFISTAVLRTADRAQMQSTMARALSQESVAAMIQRDTTLPRRSETRRHRRGNPQGAQRAYTGAVGRHRQRRDSYSLPRQLPVSGPLHGAAGDPGPGGAVHRPAGYEDPGPGERPAAAEFSQSDANRGTGDVCWGFCWAWRPPASANAHPCRRRFGTGEVGGRRGDRTPDLCIANAALSQLS